MPKHHLYVWKNMDSILNALREIVKNKAIVVCGVRNYNSGVKRTRRWINGSLRELDGLKKYKNTKLQEEKLKQEVGND